MKKGFEKSIGVVVTIVVLLVVALALILLVTTNVDDTAENTMTAEQESMCNIWKTTACGMDDTGVKEHPNIAGCSVDCGIA